MRPGVRFFDRLVPEIRSENENARICTGRSQLSSPLHDTIGTKGVRDQFSDNLLVRIYPSRMKSA
jgi:hypothetical protein